MTRLRPSLKKIKKGEKNSKASPLSEGASCHDDSQGSVDHPDHSRQIARIRRIRGQLDGIERMISDRRYCVDILTQTRAVTSAIRSLEASILETHLRSCVRDAIGAKSAVAAEEKIEELMELFSRST